jgi:hypothetical protein
MPKIGDVIHTSDGKVLQMVPKPSTGGVATLATLATLLDQLNVNLSLLIDTERWLGKYISLEDVVDANSNHSEYKFYFPLRYLRINSDQPLKIQFNDVGNPVINISVGEFPYVLPDIRPGFVIKTMYITTGSVDTNISILGMG